jgi:hypothetical protein
MLDIIGSFTEAKAVVIWISASVVLVSMYVVSVVIVIMAITRNLPICGQLALGGMIYERRYSTNNY